VGAVAVETQVRGVIGAHVGAHGIAEATGFRSLVALRKLYLGVHDIQAERLVLGVLDAAELPYGENNPGGEFQLDRALGRIVVEEVIIEIVELFALLDAGQHR